MIFDRLIPDNKIYAFSSLYPGKNVTEVRRLMLIELRKRLLKIIPVAVMVTLLFVAADKAEKNKDPSALLRDEVNGIAKQIPIVVRNKEYEQETYFTLNPVKMSDEAIDSMQKELEKVLDGSVLNGNPGFDRVRTDLTFCEEIEGFPVVLTWSTSDPSVIRNDGRVMNRENETDKTVTVCAKVSYGEEFRLYERFLTVVPFEFDHNEQSIRSALKSLLAYENETGYERKFNLPEMLNGVQIRIRTGNDMPVGWFGVLAAIAIVVGGWSGFYSALNEKKRVRFLKAERDCKDFLSKLSILLAAGLPLRSAWKKMTEDMEAEGDVGLLYENMAVTCREFMNGSPENLAYERFGERMENARYQRIAAVLSQSVTKGVADLPELLSAEIREAVADEKEKIKIRGEQASTKLLMPMMGFLVIVFAILLVPAFITF